MAFKEKIDELVKKYSDEFKQRRERRIKLKAKMDDEYFKAKEQETVRLAKAKARIETDREINRMSNSKDGGDVGEFLSKLRKAL